MAIIKHISYKNVDYSAVVDYMIREHDAKSGKPILNEKGLPVMRKEFLLDGLLCDPYSFAEECQAANQRFDVRHNRKSVKTHQYIISFDPRDRDDNGLTPEMAQTMCVTFAKKHFPGHQAIVCTHSDGHHGIGNIHTHIVINSLRILDVPQLPYMTQTSNHVAGGRHRATNAFMNHLKEDLMEMCQEHNLYQLDITKPAAIRVTDREYLDKETIKNETADSATTAKNEKIPGTREIHKSILRNAITEVSLSCNSYQEFIENIKSNYDISIKETRGVISYKCPDVNYWIRGRSLGTAFEKESLLSAFAKGEHILKDAYHGSAYREIMQNVNERRMQILENGYDGQNANGHFKSDNSYPGNQSRRTPSEISSFPGSGVPGVSAFPGNSALYSGLRSVDDLLNTPTRFERAMMHATSDLRLILDPTADPKAVNNPYYANKVTVGNLNQMSNTLTYLKQNHIDSFAELDRHMTALSERVETSQKHYAEAKDKLKDVNEKIHYLGQAAANAKTYKAWLAIDDIPAKSAYRLENEQSIKQYEDARSHLKELFNGQDWPSLKEMKAEKARLQTEKNEAYYQSKEGKGELKNLEIVKANARIILEELAHGYGR